MHFEIIFVVMELNTKISLRPATNQIDYESHLFLLGSCFSEHIGEKFSYFKFQNLQNPFGIFFHPLAIEKLISKAVHKQSYSEEDCFFLNERWHCFDVHSELSDPSKEKLLEKLNSSLENTQQQIIKSTHILITLGTAWVYRKNKSNQVVANCHKLPQKEFSKELLSVDEIQRSLVCIVDCIQTINKNVQLVFTVSPVRHLKDGFVENQRSKAHLIAAIHSLVSPGARTSGLSYFESYEIMMDELRDYRFYNADMVHPNQVAIDYIWEKFSAVWISPNAHSVIEKVTAIQKGLQHRTFNPESEQYRSFRTSLEKKITYLQQEYPHMKFGE